MKTTSLLILAFIWHTPLALAESHGYPRFTWMSDQSQLRIDFDEDGNQDVITFHETERLANLKGDPVCIMSGQLEKEQGVHVTLTRSCSSTDDFQITIAQNERLRHTSFQVTNGLTENGVDGGDIDLANEIREKFTLEKQNIEERAAAKSEFPPYGLKLKLFLHYTKKFQEYWEDSQSTDVFTAMKIIVAHAQTHFKAKSSSLYYLHLETVKNGAGAVIEIQQDLTVADLDTYSSYGYERHGNMDIFFDKITPINVAIQFAYWKSYEDEICKDRNKSAAMVLHLSSAVSTGYTLAKSVAYAAGIYNSWSWSGVKSKYEGGSLQCLDPYTCKDDRECSVTEGDCSNDLRSYFCPMTCGECSTNPYPLNGLQLNIHMHYNDEFEQMYMQHKKRTVYNIIEEAQPFFKDADTGFELRLNVCKVTKFNNPGSGHLSVNDITLLKSTVNSSDGCLADVFMGIDHFSEDHDGISGGAQICKDRIHSLAVVLHNRFTEGALTGKTLALMLSTMLGVRNGNSFSLTDLQKRYERGELNCIPKIE